LGSYRDGRKYSVRGLHYSNKHDALSSVGKLEKFDITNNRKYALARRYYSLARKEALETKDPRTKINRLGAASVYLKFINTLVKDNKISSGTKKEDIDMDQINDKFLDFICEKILTEDEKSAARFLKHQHVKSKFNRYYKDNTVPYWAVYQRIKGSKGKGKSDQSGTSEKDPEIKKVVNKKKTKKSAPKVAKKAEAAPEPRSKKISRVVGKKAKPKKKVELKRKPVKNAKIAAKKKITKKTKKAVNEAFNRLFLEKAKHTRIYSRWAELSKMGPSELNKYIRGRSSGHHTLKNKRNRGRMTINMLKRGHNKWDDNDVKWNSKKSNFLRRKPSRRRGK
jgi:hypothetical protein